MREIIYEAGFERREVYLLPNGRFTVQAASDLLLTGGLNEPERVLALPDAEALQALHTAAPELVVPDVGQLMHQKKFFNVKKGTHNLKTQVAVTPDSMVVHQKDPDIPPTNNAAERSLWTVVMARRVSQCSKNTVGAQTYMRIKSTVETARLRGQDPVVVLTALMR